MEVYESLKEIYEGSKAIHDYDSVEVINSVLSKYGTDLEQYDPQINYRLICKEVSDKAWKLGKAAADAGLEREARNLSDTSFMLAAFE